MKVHVLTSLQAIGYDKNAALLYWYYASLKYFQLMVTPDTY